jgi:hypothetical protein
MSLNVGGSELAVGAVPQATCRACDLAAVVLPKPPQAAISLGVFIAPKISLRTLSMIQPRLAKCTISGSDCDIIVRKDLPLFA